ncbi:MAG TPA: O-antigen ligase family protein [Patescibacteria group bacterium]|nr:O-antigen ligase family protein [Patescibacteria group bacterium]
MTLILFSLIFYTIIAAFRPRLALLVIIFTLPSYLIRFEVLNIPFTFLEAMILIIFAFFLVKKGPKIIKRIKSKINNKNLNKLQNYPFNYEIVAVLLIAYLAVYLSGLSFSALGVFKAYFFEPIILYILIINYFNIKTDWKKIIWALSLSALLISIVAIFQQISGLYIFNEFWSQAETRRVTSLFPYPNALGLYLTPISLLSLGLASSYLKNLKSLKNKLLSALLFFIIISSLLSMYFAKSEGALIATLISIFIYLLIYNKRTRIIAISLIIVSSSVLAFNSQANTFVEEKIMLKDKSGQIRISQWQETWQMLKNDNNWIFGVGLLNYQQAVAPYHQEGIFIKDHQDPDWLRKTLYNQEFRKSAWQPLEIYLYPHNIVLNFWVELGLLGLIVFMFLFIKIYIKAIMLLKNNKKEFKPILIAIISSISAIIIHGLVDVPYFKNDLSALFWIIVSLLALISIHSKTHDKRTNHKNNS